eukprot:TRINITY_DN50049_c0_g1_i1.p1 TRINITY_DN50049_c0_g1~~TRINITY_DN50049_c0_g1_i1.p1  ORF type:complete len:596 (+),score=92.94 TRINITY_DN50049_c0_g1_i1:204-1991(+)
MSTVPRTVYVHSLTGATKGCAGEYVLDAEELNGQPLWQQCGGVYWLGSSKASHWVFTDKLAVDNGIFANVGHLVSRAPHGGRTPDRMTCGFLTPQNEPTDVDVSLERLAAPAKLFVISPNSEHDSAGVYELLEGEDGKRNGHPVWKHQQSDLHLGSSRNGFWIITDRASCENGLAADVGLLRSATQHGGEFPHKVECGWIALSKKEVDSAIRVTERNPATVERPPATLVLESSQESHNGEYKLADELVNQLPLWRGSSSAEETWLAGSQGGYWVLTNAAAKDNGFCTNTGFIYSKEPHGGALPHTIAAWQDVKQQDIDCRFVAQDVDIAQWNIARLPKFVRKPTVSINTVPKRIRAETEEEEIRLLPDTKWDATLPERSCLEELRENAHIREMLPDIDCIIEDVEAKARNLRSDPTSKASARLLDNSELHAILAHTHEFSPTGKREGNLYFEEDRALRFRDEEGRRAMMTTWSVHIYYMLRCLGRLPSFEGTVYRVTSRQEDLCRYKEGCPIQWGHWTSATIKLDVAHELTPKSGAIFKIRVFTGKDITNISFLKGDGEILLTPNHRFVVVRTAYVECGFTFVDLLETRSECFVY